MAGEQPEEGHEIDDVILTMDDYLNQVIGVTEAGARQRLIDHGITSLEALVGKKESFTRDACVAARKDNSGQPADRKVSMLAQTRLEQLVVYCNYCHLAQLELDYEEATLDEVESVHAWVTQLGADPDADLVKTYKEGVSAREWFESIETYLSRKKGATSGMPPTALCHQGR